MSPSDVVSERPGPTKMDEQLQRELRLPQRQRDQRVEELWRKLDPAGHGELDFKGLKRGLRRIDHRELLLRL
jgi:Ca2+-binding EF-hand superfamily protein